MTKKTSAVLADLWKEYQEYLEPGNKSQADRMRFPSGIPGLDIGIGDIHGMTRGIVEILGGEAVGKTTLALTILAETQRTRQLVEIEAPDDNVYNAVYMDFEHTYDNRYAEALGVDTSKLLVLSMTYAQQQFKIVEHLLNEGIQFIIIDSIAVLIPQSEEEKELDDSEKMADEAKVIGRSMKRINALAAASDALVLVINQYRANISAMARIEKKAYGSWILKYLKKATIELTRVERQDKRMIIEAFVSKNKMGAIGTKIRYEIEHGRGIDIDQHVLKLAEYYEIVEKGGTWWYYPSKREAIYKGQGDKNAILNFPMAEIKQKVIDAMKDEAHE